MSCVRHFTTPAQNANNLVLDHCMATRAMSAWRSSRSRMDLHAHKDSGAIVNTHHAHETDENSGRVLRAVPGPRWIRTSVARRGFGPQTNHFAEGIGLRNMRERIELLGGEFSLMSRVGEGTRLKALLPDKP